jgi:transaldolase
VADRESTLRAVTEAGVSIWLDDLGRTRLTDGSLQTLIDTSSVRGITTNPSIFASVVKKSDAYDAELAELGAAGTDVDGAVRALTTSDVRDACDLLMPLHESSGGVDGKVSLEVDPRLARDTAGTVAEARALWAAVDRPNLLVKIPATREGLPAIQRVIGEGISVNVTLIFSLQRYAEVVEAYLDGLEDAQAAGIPLGTISSVASFFVSRVDTDIDPRLDALGTPEAAALRGKAGLANARLAYAHHLEVLASPRWSVLATDGATPQRPLWASTGVKDKAYDPAMYVVGLVAPGTVNTMPEPTLDATGAHEGAIVDTVTGTEAPSRAVLDGLAAVGIDYDEVVARLEDEGVEKFATSWSQLLATVEQGLTRR